MSYTVETITTPPLPRLHSPPRQGMRIDYFLLSKVLAPRLAVVKVFGSGADRDGFLGSDHSPLMLTLREGQPDGEDEEKEELDNNAVGGSEGRSGGNREEEDGADLGRVWTP